MPTKNTKETKKRKLKKTFVFFVCFAGIKFFHSFPQKSVDNSVENHFFTKLNVAI